tara:strand:+ start:8633 stop:9301 length:669 start_codon:yes stop_codon:yes gene_type:complete
MIDTSRIKVVILCGGLGTRLNGIIPNDMPKCMVDINGVPFLFRLMDRIKSYGFKKFVLCTSHGHEYIKSRIVEDNNLTISYSDELLGTGGALKVAKDKIEEFSIERIKDLFLVVNGDTYFTLDLDDWVLKCTAKGIIDRHYACGFSVLSKGLDTVNSGVYLMKKEIFNIMPEEDTFNLEEDFLRPLALRRLYVQFWANRVDENFLLDIGTLGGYERAKMYFK